MDWMARYHRALVYIPPDASDASVRSCLDVAHLVAAHVMVADAGALVQEAARDCALDPRGEAGALDVARALSSLVLRRCHDVLVTCRQEESVARQLLRLCPCPVWIGEPQRRPRRFLIALDPGVPLPDPLAAEVLRTGLALAALWDGALFVAHAWTAYGQGLMRHRLSPEHIAEYVAACRREAAGRVWRFLDDYRGRLDRARVELIHGLPADALVTAAHRHAVDVVVIGTVGRRGVRAAVLGNTVERLLPRLRTHIVAVKSPEFVCPVRPELARAIALAPPRRFHVGP